ncbi:MAG: MBL fold metallo-hydrolase, partial [Calditrichaeota bacterium]
AAFVGNLFDGIIQFVVDSAAFFSSYSWAHLDNIHPSPLHVSLFFLLIIAFVEWKNRNIRFVALCLVFVLLNWQIWSKAIGVRDPKVTITMFDVGQGDATLLQFPDRKSMLIDAGPVFPGYDPGEEVILPYLQENGIRQLDLIVVTHPHLDHFGGFLTLAKYVHIQRAVFADTSYQNKLFQKLLVRLRECGTEIQIVRRGSVLTAFEPAVFYVLGPSPAQAKIKRNWNDASLVLKLRYGNSAALFTGDTESAGEFELQNYNDILVSNLLKAGHHGSKTSSEERFLQSVNPEWVSISAGAFNKFGHPADESIAKYKKLNIAIARTDCDGALQFATDGHRLWRLIE